MTRVEISRSRMRWKSHVRFWRRGRGGNASIDSNAVSIFGGNGSGHFLKICKISHASRFIVLDGFVASQSHLETADGLTPRAFANDFWDNHENWKRRETGLVSSKYAIFMIQEIFKLFMLSGSWDLPGSFIFVKAQLCAVNLTILLN